MTILLPLAACTGNLDDPFGNKQRLAEKRRDECQQTYNITRAYEKKASATRRQNLTTDGAPIQEGLLKESKVSLQTADTLESLAIDDQNLKRLNLELAASLRQIAESKRAMAPFAEVESTLTSANARSPAHQAIVARRKEVGQYYSGMLYALEFFCDGGSPPTYSDSPVR
ncbi:MAG: hypothetical protein AAGF93_10320 [Cyanobacteria bacterium P01_H01_bin.105]